MSGYGENPLPYGLNKILNPSRAQCIVPADPDRFLPFKQALPATITGMLVLTASLVNYLKYNNYPLLTPEVGLIAAMLALVAIVIGLLYAGAGNFGRPLLEVILIYIAFDLNFDGPIVYVGALATAILLRQMAIPMLGIIAFTVLVSLLLGLGFDRLPDQSLQTAPPSQAPALVHIILDEHIGLEGLQDNELGAADLRKDLKKFYTQHGFRLFGGAYSEYVHTANSIPQILNFGIEQSWQPEQTRGVVVTSNAYFDRLRSLGYHINVYQTDILDFCSAQTIASCTKYKANDLGPVAASSLSIGDKISLISFSFLSLSESITTASKLYDFAAWKAIRRGIALPLVSLDRYRRSSPVVALAAFDKLISDLRQAKPGEAYFAHLLLPHYPYATQGDCSLKPAAGWQSFHSLDGISKIRQTYLEQVRCASAKIGLALDALAASPAQDRNIVIVHGDHGSRIVKNELLAETQEHITDSDMIAGYSTLFAVRANGIAAGYDMRRVPAAKLLTALAQSQFRSVKIDLEPGFVPSVVLASGNWRPVSRRALPASWAKP